MSGVGSESRETRQHEKWCASEPREFGGMMGRRRLYKCDCGVEEVSPAPRSWSEQMAQVHPCGHTEAQHMYHAEGAFRLDLSECTALDGGGTPPHSGEAEGAKADAADTVSASPAEVSPAPTPEIEQLKAKIRQFEQQWDVGTAAYVQMLKNQLSANESSLGELKAALREYSDRERHDWMTNDHLEEQRGKISDERIDEWKKNNWRCRKCRDERLLARVSEGSQPKNL